MLMKYPFVIRGLRRYSHAAAFPSCRPGACPLLRRCPGADTACGRHSSGRSRGSGARAGTNSDVIVKSCSSSAVDGSSVAARSIGHNGKVGRTADSGSISSVSGAEAAGDQRGVALTGLDLASLGPTRRSAPPSLQRTSTYCYTRTISASPAPPPTPWC